MVGFSYVAVLLLCKATNLLTTLRTYVVRAKIILFSNAVIITSLVNVDPNVGPVFHKL